MQEIADYDVIVIGGGPAGLAAAITARRGGARVLLIERGPYPRHKVCGEFVSAESLGLLNRLLGSNSLLQNSVRISQARLFLEGRLIVTPVGPPAASISRFDLDASLWNAASAEGVEARQQTTVQRCNGSGPFQVVTAAETFTGQAVINASGRWSNLSVSPSMNGDSEKKWLGLKVHFAEDAPGPSVDLYFFDGGYCGVQPIQLAGQQQRGRVNVCAMVEARVASNLIQVFAQHPQLLQRSRGWQPVSQPASTSPLLFRDPEPEQNGLLLAGDAAGFVDPFVGDGISLALRSGALAATSLGAFLCGQASLAEAARCYSQAYREQFLPVFRTSSTLRRILRLPAALRSALSFVLEKNPAIARYLVSQTR